MAKFFDVVGYGHSEEIPADSGIYKDVITERPYYGDVKRNARNLSTGEHLNNDLSVDNSIEIVSDAYADEHYFAIRYIKWQGVRWTISKVAVVPPRLILTLGGVYNGTIPDPVFP